MVERIRSYRVAPPERKDLSRELKDRLAHLDAEEERILAALEVVREEAKLTARMLELERKVSGAPPERRPPSIQHIVDEHLLAGIIAKQKLVEIAEEEGHEAPARSVNAILMNYFRHELVTRTDDERYNLTGKGKDTLSRKAEGV